MGIALVQFNPRVGDLRQNANKILQMAADAQAEGAYLAVFPELGLTGYPPMDMLFRDEFLLASTVELERIANEAPIPIVLGAPCKRASKIGRPLSNAAFLCSAKGVELLGIKRLLPTYNVFDERRYFEPGKEGEAPYLLDIQGLKLGITICEDIWGEFGDPDARHYPINPVKELADQGVDAILNLSASPYHRDKPKIRQNLFSSLTKKYGVPLLISGQVGANDHLIFDGATGSWGPNGEQIAGVEAFEEGIAIVPLSSRMRKDHALAGIHLENKFPTKSGRSELIAALSLSIRDYIQKTSAKGVVIGLSGGVDSALVAALAVEALGPEKVVGIRMPSQYSSDHSLDDAALLASNLGIKLKTIPIEPIVAAFRTSFLASLDVKPADLTDQNLQARARGMLLMAYSNQNGHLVLATGNKSELAMGYSTLYGDMCGALAPIGDLLKTEVWQLSNTYNEMKGREVIPGSIIQKPPSAELAPGQLDSDTLPPYEKLDDVLSAYFDGGRGATKIASDTGVDRDFAKDIIRRVNCNEFKRRQAPIIPMVSSSVFNQAYRWPVVAATH